MNLIGSRFNQGADTALAGSGSFAMPDPFLDYSSLFTPRSLPTMLQWCEQLWADNLTYRQAMERVCAYFLTDVQISDVSDSTKSRYEEFMNESFHVLPRLRELGLDYLFYGNSFSSIFMPFRRYLSCDSCGYSAPIERTIFAYRAGRFSFTCPQCSARGEASVYDRPSMEVDKVEVVRWNPHYMKLVFHPIAHRTQHVYRIPADVKKQVELGNPFFLRYIPEQILQAIADECPLFLFDDDAVFHMKEAALAGVMNRGWGIPRAFSAFKQGINIQLMKRYNEALALEYIVPWQIIVPAAGSSKADPVLLSDLSDFRGRVASMLAEHRRDPLATHVIPFPIDVIRVGGDAKALAPHELITAATDELLNGVGVPAELYRGSLQYQAWPAAIRLFESSWPHFSSYINRWLAWLMGKISVSFNWERAKAKLVAPSMADDVEARVVRIQLASSGKISDQTALSPFGIDVREEQRRILDEQRAWREAQQRVAKEEAQAQEMQRRIAERVAVQQGVMPPGMQPGVPVAGPPPMGMQGTGAGGMVMPGDVLNQADQIAQQLLAMPEYERRRQLSYLRQTDETLHAVVKQKLQNARTEARSVGQQQVLSQLAGPAAVM